MHTTFKATVWNLAVGVTAVTQLVRHVTHSTLRASSCGILSMPTKMLKWPYRRKSQEMNCLTQSRLSPAHSNKKTSRYRTPPRYRNRKRLFRPRDAYRQLTWLLVQLAKRRVARPICAWARDALIPNISQSWCQRTVKLQAKSVVSHSRQEMTRTRSPIEEHPRCQFLLLILAELLV